MDLINHDDEITCPECNGVGRVRKNSMLKHREMDTSVKKYDELIVKWGCKSLLCHSCKYYCKFLSTSTMQMICWNKGCFYEAIDTLSGDGRSFKK